MLKYFIVGLLFWAVGTLFSGSSAGFHGRSEPATLVVTDMHSRRNDEGGFQYRPVFALAEVAEPREEFAGNIWVRPQPHEHGDVVPGRYDPDTGEMRSDKMLSRGLWIGRIAQILGALVVLQGVAMLFGVPEYRLPLKVTTGRRRRTIRLWN